MSYFPKEELKKIFEEIRSRFPQLPVLGLHWGYLTNGEPSVLKEMGCVSPGAIFLSICLRVGWIFLYGFFLVLKVGFIKLYAAKTLLVLKKKKFDALAKSWIYPKSPLKPEQDFYLGDLSLRLRDEGFSLLMLCGNITGKNDLHFLSCFSRSSFPCQLPEMALVGILDIFRTCFMQCLSAVSLFVAATKLPRSPLRSVFFLASRDVLRGQTLHNVLYYFIAKRALSFWKPKVLVTLYEGNAWEKCLALGVREVLPSCKIVGFHHTILRERALDLKNPPSPVSLLKSPDCILTTGSKTLEMMRPGYMEQTTRFVDFGSFRCEYTKEEIQKPDPDRKTLLVTPEGLISEMTILFGRALEVAERLSDYRVVFRCHPSISFKQVSPFLNPQLLSLPNVEVSKAFSISEDLARSSVLLYRGSSSVLYAILGGVKPFYWSEKGEEGIDPLYELDCWRTRATSLEELLTGICHYSMEPVDIRENEWREATKYVQDYIKPVQRESIRKLTEIFV